MSANTARFVRESMVALVTNFWKEDFLPYPDDISGGKTGTAQLGGDQDPHAWFIGFSERNGKTVVIAVILENAGTAGRTAVPVFQAVATAALAE
jgi:peptidoglycan glycosyltransferase